MSDPRFARGEDWPVNIPLEDVPSHVPLDARDHGCGSTGEPPEWEEEIGVYLENGTKLFSINSGGEVYVHDHDCLSEAAVIFFREVAKVAELQGWTVDRASDRHGAQAIETVRKLAEHSVDGTVSAGAVLRAFGFEA